MQRHSSALEDFDKVLSLTSNAFDNAHLMKSRIHVRDGHLSLAQSSLNSYIKAKGRDKEAEEVEKDIKEGERFKHKTLKERNAELWNACVDSASQALHRELRRRFDVSSFLTRFRRRLLISDFLGGCLTYYHHQRNFSLESLNYPTSSCLLLRRLLTHLNSVFTTTQTQSHALSFAGWSSPLTNLSYSLMGC